MAKQQIGNEDPKGDLAARYGLQRVQGFLPYWGPGGPALEGWG